VRAFALIVPLAAALAQPPPAGRRIELLWPGGAPGAVGREDADKPNLTVYPVPQAVAAHTGVIVCPGGGYGFLATDHEGDPIARRLNSLGMAAFVLQYRIAAQRIGIWGFSAGGHLASTTGTHFEAGDLQAADPMERVSRRPDFTIRAYPVNSLTTPCTHQGSLHNRLVEHPKLVASLSNETQVTAQTPPRFLFHTDEDGSVPAENSVLFYRALRKTGGPATADAVRVTWTQRLKDWLDVRGLLK
jgi:acetyl esterase/lipase